MLLARHGHRVNPTLDTLCRYAEALGCRLRLDRHTTDLAETQPGP